TRKPRRTQELYVMYWGDDDIHMRMLEERGTEERDRASLMKTAESVLAEGVIYVVIDLITVQEVTLNRGSKPSEVPN
ncbi:MAG: hypothetical protein V3V96_16470, partial [Acidiferrobacterales bacterium]